MKKLKPIMFVGTGSDVGKSVINAGFCRIFYQDGYSPAPFKAQNMSLNSFATPEGLEIGRAQAVQAEACKIPCSVEMNPVLLKPTSYTSSQVVLHGKPVGNKSATEYFNKPNHDALFSEVMKAFTRLESQYNPVVIEGAGSISEINLKDRDIVNMRVAKACNAATFLIADIDKGGVFASVYGTIQLLPPDERALIKGIIINKFRGDINLFLDGKKKLEELTGIPVVSIIPFFRDIHIEQEDSVVLENKADRAGDGSVNIAVPLLKYMSNFTDFNMLERVEGVHLFYTASEGELAKADIIIVPGSKNTIQDMVHLRETGMAKAIINHHESGKAVYGICGGYQMMGETINDPQGVEGTITTMPGLNILPVETIITPEKLTEQCTFTFRNYPENCSGYQIHMGETTSGKPSPLCITNTGDHDGYLLNEKTWGTYIHGIFDNPSIVGYILKIAKEDIHHIDFDFTRFKNEQYDKLAELIRGNSDMDIFYKSLV